MFDINEVLNIFFSKGEVKKLKKFANVYENGDKLKKEFIEVWRYDQQISGIGGYFMPLFTPINPFNYYGRWRNVFRSIQYGRSDIFYNQRPRTLVEDSGLHLESLLKVLFYRFDNKMTLGKILEKQYKKESISYDEYRKIRVLKRFGTFQNMIHQLPEILHLPILKPSFFILLLERFLQKFWKIEDIH